MESRKYKDTILSFAQRVRSSVRDSSIGFVVGWPSGSQVALAGVALITMSLTIGCKPKIESNDPQERQRAVEVMEDQAALARVAMKDEDKSVREAAVRKLADQSVLGVLAREEKDRDVREASVSRLTDQAVLSRVAIQDEDWAVRLTAVKRLGDQTALALVAVEARDSYVREIAVSNLTDQTALAKVVMQDPVARIRIIAASNLGDQAVLSKVLMHDKNREVRMAAVRKLTDQRVIAKAAIEGEDWDMLKAAFDRLTEQTAPECEDREARRMAALGKLTDQVVLDEPALKDNFSEIRRAAVDKLTDQASLTKVATGPFPQDVRIAAVSRIQDQSILTLLADNPMGHTDDRVQAIACALLAMQDPVIMKRLGKIQVDASYTHTSQAYQAYSEQFQPSSGAALNGERLTLRLVRVGTVLIERTWRSRFPETWQDVSPLEILDHKTRLGVYPVHHDGGFLRAPAVDASDLLTELFGLQSFTQDDLCEATGSSIPEVRIAAARNLTNRAVLSKIATEDRVWQVRVAAMTRLTEQKSENADPKANH